MATAKKSSVKKTSAKKVTAKKSMPKKAHFKSFKVHKNATPFFSFHITEQTVYWMILLALIFGLGIWVLNIQINISNILNSINSVNGI